MKSKWRKLLKTLGVILVAIVLLGLSVNTLIMPKVRNKIVEQLNVPNVREVSIEKISLRPLAATASIKNIAIEQKLEDANIVVSIPRTSIRPAIKSLLGDRIVVNNIVLANLDLVYREPGSPLRAMAEPEVRRVVQAGILPNLSTLIPLAQNGKEKRKEILVEKIIVKNGTIKYESQEDTPLSIVVEKFNALVQNLLIDEDGNVLQCDITSLEGSWHNQESGGLSYTGEATIIDDVPDIKIVGDIMDFPLPTISPTLENEAGLEVQEGFLSLSTDLSFKGHLLDSVNTLKIRSLEIATADYSRRRSELDVLPLIVQILKLSTGSDEQIFEDIQLHADMSDDPKKETKRMIRSALTQMIVQLQGDLFGAILGNGDLLRDAISGDSDLRKDKEKLKETLKDIGRSLFNRD